ncbi:MAG: radical SAM family heme chaperone HemW [Zymomonas mobilis subsp. pomaceae]|uniref:Heme chaperone HemW n=1 Tax=Zymomonas mobilis subsp. pomaceae (strain ATCC 29192 / DSM 22645 / JCM 10191 / CCUG 17912 / NBRC 13757 / NCIMB 11200 / NRRL B-4491 / Barker I) TaxID=579138 RepID=F8ETT6_ZYMMT|nr:radical SAM family heme chaperone HemW [Zymomonas mobilis]AEI38033.1 oxygen-independent coproporphyrinogen III oxidase [Zymomonas mobilis subsp. pomaceae ATCC 29192]MDX5949400.1 radical SAM family heme chaperone HemW [Zymomonas mobilis subsp. pomaceae]GEB89143.1 coproporphyrinogen III oxidase [Zymomonas mobilis subsp. pomaceae]
MPLSGQIAFVKSAEKTPLALYIHWPFCLSKCPYCDFNSHVRENLDQTIWRTALLADMAYEASFTRGRPLGSIFFGGGTPSLMPPETVASLIEAACHYWPPLPNIEITLEANPSSVEAARFEALAQAGVNRLSLGIQALDDDVLGFLGRIHTVEEALKALNIAQHHFPRVSFDLIYGRPHQSFADWGKELNQALSFGTDHLSLYQLTIEEGTRFSTLVRQNKWQPMDGDNAADLFELTRDITEKVGLPAYEISNHARLGSESRHNMTYWRYGDYIGVGAGAHGRRLHKATMRYKKPENWLKAIENKGCAVQEEILLKPKDQAVEAVLMGLRLAEGVDLSFIAAKTGLKSTDYLNEKALDQLIDQAVIMREGTRLKVNRESVLLTDAITREILR